MKYSIMFVFFVGISISFGAVNSDDSVKVEIDILLSDQETGDPLVNIKVIVSRNDSVTLNLTTDQNGRISLTEKTAPSFAKPGYKYTIHLDEVDKRYSGISDAFSTEEISCNTRIIRDLKVLHFVHPHRSSFVVFDSENSMKLDSLNLLELSYLRDVFYSYPTIVMSIVSIYDNDSEIDLAYKRAYIVQLKLIEMGIAQDQLILEVEKRKIRTEEQLIQDITPVSLNEDVTFKIVSFD